MMRKEAIVNLEKLIALFHTASEQSKMVDYSKIIETLEFAAAALRGPTREMVEKVWRGCYTCDEYKYFMFNAWTNPESSERPDCMGTSLFCPQCGKPLTDEAVDMMLERWKALYD